MENSITKSPNLPATDAARKLAELKREKERQELAESRQNQLATVPHHLCLLIDVSGSMDSPMSGTDYYASPTNPARLEAAITAMRHLVAAADPTETAFTLVTFDSYPKVVVPKTTNYTVLQTTTLQTAGSTNMYDGIREAIAQQPTRIILLSDGQPNNPAQALLAAQMAADQSILIDTISIGECDDKLMQQIAALTGGTWIRCNDTESLSNHFVLLEPKNYLQIEHKE